MKKILTVFTTLALVAGIPMIAFAAMPNGLSSSQEQASTKNITVPADKADSAADRIAVLQSQSAVIQAAIDEVVVQTDTESTTEQTPPNAEDNATAPVTNRSYQNAGRGENCVDADGNGVCDNYENGIRPNGGAANGTCPNGYDCPRGNGGQGQANRVCDGTGQGAGTGLGAGAGSQGAAHGHHGGR